jgi:NADH-quinone oxidoreductase subunit C
MKNSNKTFILEMKDLIKNLMNFCNYKIDTANQELSILVDHGDLVKTIMFFKDNPSFNMTTLIDLTAVDYPNREYRFLVVYNLLSVSKNFRIKIKAKITEENPVPSITDIFQCANWYEREVYDLFGIRFLGHPDLRRILTDYDFSGHPLRKDFPLSGFTQVKYDNELRKVISEPVKLDQEYRNFDNLSPWEGMSKYLPGDEKSGKLNDKN